MILTLGFSVPMSITQKLIWDLSVTFSVRWIQLGLQALITHDISLPTAMLLDSPYPIQHAPSVRTEYLSSPCFLSLSSRQSLSLKAAGLKRHKWWSDHWELCPWPGRSQTTASPGCGHCGAGVAQTTRWPPPHTQTDNTLGTEHSLHRVLDSLTAPLLQLHNAVWTWRNNSPNEQEVALTRLRNELNMA